VILQKYEKAADLPLLRALPRHSLGDGWSMTF